MIPRVLYLGAILLFGLALQHSAAAQVDPTGQTAELTRPECRQCTISLTPVVTLGDLVGDGVLDAGTSLVARDRRGRFLVWNDSYRSSFKVFEPTGAFVGEIGTAGDGPGEFRNIVGIIPLPGDSLAVIDAKPLRITILAPDYSYVRSHPLEIPPSPRFVFLPDGRILMNSGITA